MSVGEKQASPNQSNVAPKVPDSEEQKDEGSSWLPSFLQRGKTEQSKTEIEDKKNDSQQE